VHDASGRTGAFILVGCAEITSQHRQSERATPSPDADASPLDSRFELASGGTVFLDAVNELPPDFQRALHNTLEKNRGHIPGVRLIASTTHDMRVPPAGGFLPLFQWLATNRVTVPPLIDRREDILRLSIISSIDTRDGWGR
jgi:transcriptional regulator with AAA-type ATPase domain